MQRKQHPGQASTAASGLETGVNALQGGGQPLDAATRSFFEPRFGHDFSQVRVHTGSRAHDLASAVQARAFTLGRDIVFARGEYTPGDSTGRRLLAHELTHVVQQRHSAVSRTLFRAPSISGWEFKNIGTTSDDNCCVFCQPPLKLGVDCQPARGYFNGMELKAFIQGDDFDTAYDLKRTLHLALSARRADGSWKTLKEEGPDSDDDIRGDDDECLIPQYDLPRDEYYIYSEDRPGFPNRAQLGRDPEFTDVAYIINFKEFVRITARDGTATDDPYVFKWHTVSWATKVNGSWEPNLDNSEIEPGHRASIYP
jgi:hypothetical protein